jgi:putative endonuclease
MRWDSLRYVYIMASRSRVLYAGSTTDLRRRVYQHKCRLLPGFTCDYNVDRLVYFEQTDHARAALERERQIKGWRRSKKIMLIESVNPGWLDLAVDWFPDISGQGPSVRSG